MNREISREYFIGLSNDLLKGNLNAVIERFQCPLVVYLENSPCILATDAKIRIAVEHYRALLLRRGAKIAAVDATSKHARHFVVTKTFLDRNATVLGTVRAKYFLRQDRAQIEMIEYLQNPFLEKKCSAITQLAA